MQWWGILLFKDNAERKTMVCWRLFSTSDGSVLEWGLSPFSTALTPEPSSVNHVCENGTKALMPMSKCPAI
jgi:hypothetical protein